MILYIKGTVAGVEENGIVLENNGIGYFIFMPASVLAGCLHKDEELLIHTYLQVKEDDMQLYGFLKKDDLKIFKLLIGVNGIGPKAGMGILSALSADELRFAVLSQDAPAIAKAPGIGKKTAQKVILELKDKLSLQDAFEQKLANQNESDVPLQQDERREAVQALVALGYSNAEALRAVKLAAGEGSKDVEELLKTALKKMI